jgi:hypothetical protein
MDWFLIIVGICLSVSGILLSYFNDVDKKQLGTVIFGVSLLGGVLLSAGIINPVPSIILIDNVEYKSIDIQEAEYYIVDNEGNIYEITQEQWNDLDVPVLTNTEELK